MGDTFVNEAIVQYESRIREYLQINSLPNEEDLKKQFSKIYDEIRQIYENQQPFNWHDFNSKIDSVNLQLNAENNRQIENAQNQLNTLNDGSRLDMRFNTSKQYIDKYN